MSNGKNILYSLNQFIEANTNILYQINPINTNVCHPIDKNINENITSKKPIVLFYDLKKCNIPINVNSQIDKTYQLQNQKIQQNFNQQNNFQNVNINNVYNFQNNNFNNNFDVIVFIYLL